MRNNLLNLWTRLFAKSKYQKLNNFLFDLSTHGLGILNFKNEIMSGEYHFISKILPKYCTQDSPVFLDIGANLGDYSKLLLDSFPKANVIAFEPHPLTSERLKAEFGSRIKLLQMALGAENGTISLFDYSNADGSQHASVYEGVIKDLHNSEAVSCTVEVNRLDFVAEKLSLSERISLVKIDTEGNELDVLKGSEQLIKGGIVDLFHVEFNEMNVISRVFMRDIQKILSDYVGYRLLPAGGLRLSKNPLTTELFAFQNIIFIHKRFSPDDNLLPTVIY